MAEIRLEVLLQFTNGLPWRQASEEQKKKAMESWRQLYKKWKGSGIHLIGNFSASRALDRYSNNLLFAIKDIQQYNEMTGDLMDADATKWIEDWRMVLGQGFPQVEELWKSL
jgi:chlorite dismutase